VSSFSLRYACQTKISVFFHFETSFTNCGAIQRNGSITVPSNLTYSVEVSVLKSTFHIGMRCKMQVTELTMPPMQTAMHVPKELTVFEVNESLFVIEKPSVNSDLYRRRILFCWGDGDWDAATITKFYVPPRTKQNNNVELTFSADNTKRDTTLRTELYSTDVNAQSASWVLLQEPV
jgi:hypothetical protein